MKIVIAPDSFKESMSALEACEAIERGWKKVIPSAQFIKVPIGDGGEGTVESVISATGGELVYLTVTGPLGEPVEGYYGLTGNKETAVIEMAAASGLHLSPAAQRNPLTATSKGTGELIAHALSQGVKRILLGLGGSATNDGGAGMAQALGARFLNKQGQELEPGGEPLRELHRIDLSELDPRLQQVKIEVACDVDNPLIGPLGASAVFGPQKGATEEMVALLDEGLEKLGQVLEKELSTRIITLPGAGAAGGLGAGAVAFLGGTLKRGIDIVLDVTQFDHSCKDADLVITGEGKIDSQTIYGKAPIGVASYAKRYNVPVIALTGMMGSGYEAVFEHGIDAVFSIVNGAVSLEEALAQGAHNAEIASENIARLMLLKLNQ